MIIIHRKGNKKLVIGIIVIVIVGLAFYPILHRLGIRYERMTEKEARQDLTTKNFFDFFDEFDVYVQNLDTYQDEFYNYAGSISNFTLIGQNSNPYPEIENTFYFRIYIDSEDYRFVNISIILKRNYIGEPITSELNIMIFGHNIYYYENEITENIFLKFSAYIHEIVIAIF